MNAGVHSPQRSETVRQASSARLPLPLVNVSVHRNLKKLSPVWLKPRQLCVVNNDERRTSAECARSLAWTPGGQEQHSSEHGDCALHPPEVERILPHSGAFPLCTCVFGVVRATDGALSLGAGLGRPALSCRALQSCLST